MSVAVEIVLIITIQCVKSELVTDHKRVVRYTVGLLSSDWLKITFIFHVGRGQGCDGVRDW